MNSRFRLDHYKTDELTKLGCQKNYQEKVSSSKEQVKRIKNNEFIAELPRQG